jgi:hypothetical protein
MRRFGMSGAQPGELMSVRGLPSTAVDVEGTR